MSNAVYAKEILARFSGNELICMFLCIHQYMSWYRKNCTKEEDS